MDKKVYLSIIIFFSLSIFACAEHPSQRDRSYTIPLINEDLMVQSDGSVHVVEKIHYSFEGTFHGINRYIPITSPQQITNVNVTTDGAYSSFQVCQNSTEDIKVFLYSDAAKTTPITVGMSLLQFPMIFQCSENLQRHSRTPVPLVPNKWEVDIGQVVANIHTNSSQGVQYWLNPPYYNKSSQWQNNTLTVTSDTIPAGQYYEVRMAIPTNQFDSNPAHAIIINQNGLGQIERIQNDYPNSLNFRTNLY